MSLYFLARSLYFSPISILPESYLFQFHLLPLKTRIGKQKERVETYFGFAWTKLSSSPLTEVNIEKAATYLFSLVKSDIVDHPLVYA